MRILITGSGGFLGKSLADGSRAAGHEVIGLDRSRVERNTDATFCVDILDRKALIDCFVQLRPEGVVHLAARTDISKSAKVTDYRENIEGVRHVIDAIHRQRRTPVSAPHGGAGGEDSPQSVLCRRL